MKTRTTVGEQVSIGQPDVVPCPGSVPGPHCLAKVESHLARCWSAWDGAGATDGIARGLGR